MPPSAASEQGTQLRSPTRTSPQPQRIRRRPHQSARNKNYHASTTWPQPRQTGRVATPHRSSTGPPLIPAGQKPAPTPATPAAGTASAQKNQVEALRAAPVPPLLRLVPAPPQQPRRFKVPDTKVRLDQTFGEVCFRRRGRLCHTIPRRRPHNRRLQPPVLPGSHLVRLSPSPARGRLETHMGTTPGSHRILSLSSP
jgi:hypothetical protein